VFGFALKLIFSRPNAFLTTISWS